MSKLVSRNSTGQERVEWHIQSVGKNCQPRRILYLAKLSFSYKGERKTFLDKQKVSEFITTKPARKPGRSSSSRNEKVLIRIMKTYKKKKNTQTVKANIQSDLENSNSVV